MGVHQSTTKDLSPWLSSQSRSASNTNSSSPVPQTPVPAAATSVPWFAVRVVQVLLGLCQVYPHRVPRPPSDASDQPAGSTTVHLYAHLHPVFSQSRVQVFRGCRNSRNGSHYLRLGYWGIDPFHLQYTMTPHYRLGRLITSFLDGSQKLPLPEDLNFLARPGIMFVLCQWLQGQLVWLLALKEATPQQRAEFERTGRPCEELLKRCWEMYPKVLSHTIKEFKKCVGDNLTADDCETLETLHFYRNALAHGFFHLSDLEGDAPVLYHRSPNCINGKCLDLDDKAFGEFVGGVLNVVRLIDRVATGNGINYRKSVLRFETGAHT